MASDPLNGSEVLASLKGLRGGFHPAQKGGGINAPIPPPRRLTQTVRVLPGYFPATGSAPLLA